MKLAQFCDCRGLDPFGFQKALVYHTSSDFPVKLNFFANDECLQDVESQITKLANILHVLKHIDYHNYSENYEELTTAAALRAERITCQLRKLVYSADLTEKSSLVNMIV